MEPEEEDRALRGVVPLPGASSTSSVDEWAVVRPRARWGCARGAPDGRAEESRGRARARAKAARRNAEAKVADMALGTLAVEAARRVLSARTARLTRETARARVVGTSDARNLKERWTADTFPASARR